MLKYVNIYLIKFAMPGQNQQTINIMLTLSEGMGWDFKGLQITRVSSGSPAEKAGVRTGDRLITMQGHPVSSIEQIRDLDTQHPEWWGTPVSYQLARHGGGKII